MDTQHKSAPSFATVTEVPGSHASCEQLAMAYTRYRVAGELAVGKDVLEVACGSGMGLGYLARKARRVVGGDYDSKLVEIARRHYGERVEIRQMDAQVLPFPEATFDVVVFLEAIYYLPRPQVFMAEARRVLRPGGCLFICSANKEWDGFNPSPFSLGYYSLRELGSMLAEAGFKPELLAGFPVPKHGAKTRLINTLRRVAVRFHLIPKTMNGKKLLKRLVFGKLQPMPKQITDETGTFHPPAPHPPEQPVTEHKVLYAIGRL